MQAIRQILCLIIIIGSAQLTITTPEVLGGIPITGQSLAVMVCSIFLNKQEATIVIITYLVLGIMGFPVFADGSSGLDKIIGGSGGFLYGFLVIGILMAHLGTIGYRDTLSKAFFAMMVSTIVLLFFGNLHLSFLYGLETALEYGLYPFVKGAMLKTVLGAVIIFGIERNEWLKQH